MTDPTAPLDELHASCVAALHTIRHQFAQAHQHVTEWRPAPPPQKQGRST